jgi:hypothetical protein
MANPKSAPLSAEDEDLFDFAALKDALDTTDQDELDVEQFLAAVGAATEDEKQQQQQQRSGLGVSEAVLREVEGLQKSQEITPKAPPPAANGPATSAPEPTPAKAAPQTPPPPPQLVAVSGGGLPRPVWIAGLLLLGVNAVGLALALFQQKHTTSELETARAKLEQAAAGVGEGLRSEIERFERGTANATSAALESGVSLEHVQRSLEDHDYALARRQIYSLLSTIDRLAPERRAALEARANFMLADSYRLEGFHRSAEEARQ